MAPDAKAMGACESFLYGKEPETVNGAPHGRSQLRLRGFQIPSGYLLHSHGIDGP